MSNQEITRWERHVGVGFFAPKNFKWVKGKGGMLSALDIRYNFDGKTQREVVHAVYPGLKKSVRLPDVPF